ncbi:MAG: AraC family transcriptional regulator [Oscillibacter sp.]|nr:AraC family transcriptional regulator [Oscillibacter sp.]
MKIHRHEDIYQIYYSLTGTTQYKFNGQKASLSKGQYVIINPGADHGLIKCISKSDILDIKFAILDDGLRHDINDVCLKVSAAPRSLIEIFELIRTSNESGSFYSRKQRSLYLEALLYEVLEIKTRKDHNPLLRVEEYSLCTRRVASLLDGLVVAPQFEYSLETIANMLGYNARYMARKFRKETGFSVAQYLTIHRIEKAKEFLQNTDMPINQIADLLAFNSAVAFSNKFKLLTGLSPLQYREAAIHESTLISYSSHKYKGGI